MCLCLNQECIYWQSKVPRTATGCLSGPLRFAPDHAVVTPDGGLPYTRVYMQRRRPERILAAAKRSSAAAPGTRVRAPSGLEAAGVVLAGEAGRGGRGAGLMPLPSHPYPARSIRKTTNSQRHGFSSR
jgi:hypothetical protein